MPDKFLENIKPREYQQKIFESCVKNNCLVVLPTGLGKTLIALMLTIERMKQHPGEKVVLLAPTKPLAEQHLNTFKKHLPELFADMQLFTGMVKSDKRQEIWKTADIIFSTPQCVANDIRKNLYSLENVCLLIEDEAHRCVKNYDYNFIAKKYQSQAKHPRILGLTASPGRDEKRIKQICRNLFIKDVELRTRDSDDVKEYLQELKFEKIMVDFPPELEEIRQVLKKLFDGYVEELKRRRVLYTYPSKTGLIQLQKKMGATLARGGKNFNYMLGLSACAQAIKIQHALELLETQTLTSFHKYLKNLFNQAAKKQSKGVIKLVAKPEFNFAYSSANELLIKGKEHPKLEKLIEIIQDGFYPLSDNKSREGGGSGTKRGDLPEGKIKKKPKIMIFTQFRDTATAIVKKLNEIKGVKSKTFVGQAKKEGTGLSQKEQKKIIQEFSDGDINILVATSIGEEGLDIPEVNSVIFYEPIPSAIRSIQRAGRTARLMKGKLIILVTKKTRDETFFYASRAREKSMHKAMKSIKDELSNNQKLEFQDELK